MAQAKAQEKQARQQTHFRAEAHRANAGAIWIATTTCWKNTMYARPLDGIVTDLPVRVGETVVPGVQNSAASTIMTIADMSLITAEVKVDETDIVNVKIGSAGRSHHRRHAESDLSRDT